MEKDWNAIKDWTNKIFLFHQKPITKETLQALKKTLFSHYKQQYYTFTTNEQRSIIISFAQGEVVIKQQQDKLLVHIDENTKQKIYELKQKIQEKNLEEILSNKDEKFQSFVEFSEETF